MYDNGEGVPQDYQEAMKWYRLAAEQGARRRPNQPRAHVHQRRGVPQDDQEAVKWYRLAAEQGLAAAQTNLGLMYDNGKGAPQDDQEAMKGLLPFWVRFLIRLIYSQD